MRPLLATRRIALLGCWLALAGCASIAEPPIADPATPAISLPQPGKVTPFSTAVAGGELPAGWKPYVMARFKRPTKYELVADTSAPGRTVLRASAANAASGLIYPITVDLKQTPLLAWRWRVNELIKSADNTKSNREDSPVRLIVTFSGDQSSFDFAERMFASQIKAVTGRELPYATLMYIWENRAPKGTLIPSNHTGRVKMIVAESGADKLGAWQEVARNVLEDYRRAFGEEPPPVAAIAILTDSDNTGEDARGYYGDISFRAR